MVLINQKLDGTRYVFDGRRRGTMKIKMIGEEVVICKVDEIEISVEVDEDGDRIYRFYDSEGMMLGPSWYSSTVPPRVMAVAVEDALQGLVIKCGNCNFYRGNLIVNRPGDCEAKLPICVPTDCPTLVRTTSANRDATNCPFFEFGNGCPNESEES